MIELAYEDYRRQQVLRHIESMSQGDFQALTTNKRREYRPRLSQPLSGTLDELAISGARAEVEKTLKLISLGEFVAFRSGLKSHQVPEGQNTQQLLFFLRIRLRPYWTGTL